MMKFGSLLLLAALLSACAAATQPAPILTSAPPNPPPTAATLPAASATPIPATASPAPSSTAVPPTLIPSPTPTPANPMSIEVMRASSQAGAYPGSDITLEQELEPGDNYRRYYASYLSEGLKIYALLTIPNGDPPPGGWPAIVFNHGYIPPDVYVTTERYIAYVDNLARSGYIVFRIDYRGHDRSEGSARGAYGDPGYTIDVLNAVASIKRFPQANPQKIGMWGHSMGGFLILRAMVILPDIKAGVIWAGVVGSYPDMLYNWRRPGLVPVPTTPPTARRWRQEWVQRYGTPEQNPAFWDSVSANNFLEDLSGPVQLHHGLDDEDVPPAFSETLAQQIQAAGGSVELFTYPGTNHNLTQSFSAAMARTIAFYDQYLKAD